MLYPSKGLQPNDYYLGLSNAICLNQVMGYSPVRSRRKTGAASNPAIFIRRGSQPEGR